MNAKLIPAFALAALVGLVLAPTASAQPYIVASTTPVAQSGSSGLTVVAEGQQSSTAPTPAPKVVRGSANWDPQAPPPPPAPPAPPAAAKESGQAPKVQMPMVQMPKGQLVNVKIEFTITDQIGTKPPTKKTMTLTVADKENGRIRTNTDFAQRLAGSAGLNWSSAPLSVDVMPTIDTGKIRLDFTLEYNLYQEQDLKGEGSPLGKTSVSERFSAVLDSGVPLIVAQSSDAVTDRKLTIEVKAIVVK
jgi:hypothetical protein